MANQNPVTYQRPAQRDWSSEITHLPGQSVMANGGTRSMMDHAGNGTRSMMDHAGNDTRSVMDHTGNDTRSMMDHTGNDTRSMMDHTGNDTRSMMDQNGTRASSDTGLGGMEREAQAERNSTGGVMGGNRTADEAAADWMRTLPAMAETNHSLSNGVLATNGHPNHTLSGRMPDNWANQIGEEIENHLPDDMIEAPTTLEEVYRGSMKSLLLRNLGNYVVATFLIGTQGTVSWEGILYDVGNDYVAIYQSGRDQYIVCDLYSLKYVEFYDTQRRALCDAVLMDREENNLRA